MQLTHARLRELLRYDPDTGEFTRRVKVSTEEAGKTAGYWCLGYRMVSVDGIACEGR